MNKLKHKLKSFIAVILAAAALLAAIPLTAAADTVLYGDIDQNGTVDSRDAMHLLQCLCGITSKDRNKYDIQRWLAREEADANEDGEINIIDALYILRLSAGLEDPDTLYVNDVTLSCGNRVTLSEIQSAISPRVPKSSGFKKIERRLPRGLQKILQSTE